MVFAPEMNIYTMFVLRSFLMLSGNYYCMATHVQGFLKSFVSVVVEFWNCELFQQMYVEHHGMPILTNSPWECGIVMFFYILWLKQMVKFNAITYNGEKKVICVACNRGGGWSLLFSQN